MSYYDEDTEACDELYRYQNKLKTSPPIWFYSSETLDFSTQTITSDTLKTGIYLSYRGNFVRLAID